MDNQDPLLKLVMNDTKEIDRKKLAELLEPFIVLDQTSHNMNFKDKFFNLEKNADKLEIVFLGNKAKALIFPDKKGEGLSQSDLLAMEIMPKGSVKSTLKVLSDNRKVLKNKEGRYYVPGYRLSELYSKFMGGKK